ncbi:general odorant-binding protein 99a-like [Episyrphus balteatus]|uniref:general odorant-binding protein 99a-like n=1 Tax=Episyrphus balteatus TaxID=286459 RepID=UPI002486A903|nr:general odorant-binding protein 99a-like [Episyrphus balteatus]
MKIYIILALVAFTSATEWKRKTMEEWRQIHITCDERFNVSQHIIEKSKDEKYPPKEMFEIVLCILRDVEVWNDTDGFSVDRLMIATNKVTTKYNINKQIFRDYIESCADKNIEGSNPLDWAYRCFKCFKDNEKLFKVLKKAKFYEDQDENV